MSNTLIPVILAGGKGERFWPLSRLKRPKQFLSLDGSGKSLLQATADRLLPIAGDWSNLWVVTASHLAEGVKTQLPDLPTENLLVEPEGRDTAPAVAWSTLELTQRYGEAAIAGFFPADHWIAEETLFQQTLAAASALAVDQQGIVTLGVLPSYASTGYGYIEQGETIGQYQDFPAYSVKRFTEKPDRATAESFLASQRFSWNSGMFIFQTGVMLQELDSHAPGLMQALRQQGVQAYPQIQKLSIDYAVMEKTQRAYVLPVSFSWDDLGDWNATERLLKGEESNLEMGRHIGLDTQDSIFYNSNADELIVTIGLEDVVVVRDGKATLIVRKDRTQDIKAALSLIKQQPEFQDLL